MNLVHGREVKFVGRCRRLGLYDGERADEPWVEFGGASLLFDFEAEILRIQVDQVSYFVLGFLAAVSVCSSRLAGFRRGVAVLSVLYRGVDSI